jgi:hypothetical protein
MDGSARKDLRVYMDTNVIDIFLKDFNCLNTFLELNKNYSVRFLCGLHLLTELVINPDPEAAKTNLRIVNALCSKHCYLNDTETLLKAEIEYILEGKSYSPFATRTQAEAIFNTVWSSIDHPQFDTTMRQWNKQRKKEFYFNDKQLWNDLKKGNHTASQTFPETLKLQLSEKAFWSWLISLAADCNVTIDSVEMQKIIEHRKNAPLINCATLGEACRFHGQFVDKHTRPKFGDDYDGIHLFHAGYADIFLTLDPGFLALMAIGKNEWPFEFMSPDTFLRTESSLLHS